MSRRRNKHFKDSHHLYPTSRRVPFTKNYQIRLWRERHEAWHKLFRRLTLPEIIALLQRVQQRHCR